MLLLFLCFYSESIFSTKVYELNYDEKNMKFLSSQNY